PRQRNILTIHDLAFFRMEVHGPRLDAAFRHWTKLALNWAGTVIALSENTRRDIEALGIEPNSIAVIYGGGHVVNDADIQFHRWDELRQSLKLPDRFVLFVGALQPRKNIPFLLRGFAALKQAHPELPHSLVLAGPYESAAEQIQNEI